MSVERNYTLHPRGHFKHLVDIHSNENHDRGNYQKRIRPTFNNSNGELHFNFLGRKLNLDRLVLSSVASQIKKLKMHKIFWQISSSVFELQAECGGSLPRIPYGGECESRPRPREFQRFRRSLKLSVGHSALDVIPSISGIARM